MTDQPPTDQHDPDPSTDQVGNQPTDHDAVVGDQPPTDLNQPGEESALISLDEAAVVLGITVNAVRQRIKRGTVVGIKTEAGWLVDMVATNQRHGEKRSPTTATDRPTDHVVDPTNQQPTTDLTPIADVIREQHRAIAEQANRIAELSAAAAMWQTRALHLEEQLKQLSATVESTGETGEQPERDEIGEEHAGDVGDGSASQESVWGRLVRWVRG